MEKEFKEFLNKKFGEHITNKLLDKNKLSLNKGESVYLYNGDLEENKKKVIELVESKYHEKINENEWAFDFPGWIGELDFTKVNVKEILVIGMEPHIGEGGRTAQVTYGLRETADNEFSELGEHLGNRRLWNNLNAIFNNDDNKYYYEDTYKKPLDLDFKDFLEKIYITDMSHFAIKGTVKKTIAFKDWKNIRTENAINYISETITLIRPKFIVSQGRKVADFINENFGFAKEKDFEYFRKNKDGIYHVILPHLASGNTNNFWFPKNPEKREPNIDKIKIQFDKLN
jgi:hypothetical protein